MTSPFIFRDHSDGTEDYYKDIPTKVYITTHPEQRPLHLLPLAPRLRIQARQFDNAVIDAKTCVPTLSVNFGFGSVNKNPSRSREPSSSCREHCR